MERTISSLYLYDVTLFDVEVDNIYLTSIELYICVCSFSLHVIDLGHRPEIVKEYVRII